LKKVELEGEDRKVKRSGYPFLGVKKIYVSTVGRQINE